jgi:hypothetical protein
LSSQLSIDKVQVRGIYKEGQVTHNLAHYERVPEIELENWMKEI